MIRMLQQELTNQNRLIDENIISSWRLDSNNLDSVGTNNGISEGGNSYPNAVISKGKDFTSGNVIIPNNLNLSFTNGVNDVAGSVSMLINFNDITGLQFLMCKRNFNGGVASVDREWQIYYDGDTNETIFVIFDAVLGGRIKVTSSFTPITNQYYSLICTYNGSGLHGGLNMYLNGVNSGSTSLLGSYTKTYNYNNSFTLGVESWDRSLRHKGIGDEYKKWNIELTPEEAMHLATQELAGIRVAG